MLWTDDSVLSRNVKEEANEALQLEKLIPIKVGNIKPPMFMRMVQSISWSNKAHLAENEFDSLLFHLKQFLGEAPVNSAKIPGTRNSRPEHAQVVRITVPSLGELIEEVTLAKWLINDGDFVHRDELLAELESEKAIFELNAEQSGIIKTSCKAGDTLTIGATIGYIEVTEEQPAHAERKSIAVRVPDLSTSIEELTLASCLRKDGAFVQRDEVIAELESEKATFEVSAEASGKLTWRAAQGDKLRTGDIIAKIELL